MIEVSHLTQVYKSGKGIFDVSFTIDKGEVFGYLGPNGAGKTTTIRNLLGFVNAGCGTATINGVDPRQNPQNILGTVGYLPGEIAFFDSMTGTQFLKFLDGMRNQPGMDRAHELLDRLELEPSVKIKKMSKGMKQKLGIVAAFMHDPQVLILDEPTSGLDPLMQNEMLKMVMEEKSKGKTVLMSSHSFEEIEKTCDRAGIIREGKLVSIEDIASLKNDSVQKFIVRMARKADVDKLLQSTLGTAKKDETRVEIKVDGSLKEMLTVLSKLDVVELGVVPRTLEDVFMKFYGKGESK